MMRIVLTGVSLLAVFLTLAGCRTAPPAAKPPVKPAVSAATPSPAGPAKSRSADQQAEADARFMAGMLHDVNDEPEAALDDFYKAARADIGNEVLVLDLSTRFILLKHYDQALALLHKALAQPGASALLDSRLGFVQLAMGNTNAAIGSHRNAIHKAPRSIAGYESLFHLYRQTGQTNQALQILEQAAKVSNPEADFLVELSEMYYLQSRATQRTNDVFRERAKQALQRAAKLNPTNFFVLQKLADGLTQNGERKQATVILRKIQELYPDLPSIRERLVNLLWSERDRKGASEQLEALIRENPTDPQAYYLLGMIAFDDQRYKEAVDSFHKTLLLKPDFEPAYYELAVCKVNLDQPKEALEILAKARERFQDTFLVEYCSALAYTRQKDYTNALQRLTAAEVIASATDTNRLTHVFYFQIGSALERSGRWAEGEKYLKKCLKMSPDFSEALNYLGYMYAEKATNLAEAREMIERALKQEPDNAAFIDSLGWVLFQLGQPREALKQIQRAIELNKEPDATLYDHLGDILAALKEHEKAREAWRKALDLEPTPALRKKLGLSAP